MLGHRGRDEVPCTVTDCVILLPTLSLIPVIRFGTRGRFYDARFIIGQIRIELLIMRALPFVD